MHVRSDSLGAEIRVAVEAAVEVANRDLSADDREPEAIRTALIGHDFMPARTATDEEIDQLVATFSPVADLIRRLPGTDLDHAVAGVNNALAGWSPAPTLSAHDGVPLHIHWTPDSAPLDERFVVDVLMALARTLCDHGVGRFGRCGADDCDRVFFDATKNRSRRFCTDPRCASRTHTQEHRARARAR